VAKMARKTSIFCQQYNASLGFGPFGKELQNFPVEGSFTPKINIFSNISVGLLLLTYELMDSQ